MAIASANSDTNLLTTGLQTGNYKVYTVDAAGNLSDASGGTVAVSRITSIELSAIANGNCTGGFVINGQALSDESGTSVSAAGDGNGDGLADLIVGAHRSTAAATRNSP